MSEKNKNIYNVCTDKDKVIPELWRAVFLARISNIKAVENVEVKVLSEDELAQIGKAPYSDALAHLLIMYGAGYFSFDNLSSIVRDAPNYKDEIYAAEDFIIKQADLDEKERVSEHIIQNILLCTINSKKYSEIQPIGFDTARQLCENKHTVILNGFVFVRDMNFLTLLVHVEELMGHFVGGQMKVVTAGQVINDFTDNKSIEDKLFPKIINSEETTPGSDKAQEKERDILDNDYMPEIPFVLNVKNVFYIHQLYEKPYVVEFVLYAKANGIPFDDNFVNEYTAYIRRTKRQFTVAAISRKREICGDDINWFDYGTTRYADKQIIIDNKFDLTEHIDLSGDIPDDENLSDEELSVRAVDTFLVNKTLPDKTVLEVTFSGKKILYLLIDGKIAKTLESEKFRKIPFDYNNVWTTVMEWSRSKLIQKKGNSIVVPISELQKLPENDQEYAKRMIAEQYSLKKSNNKMLQKLSDLKNYANKEMKVKEQQKALKDNRAAPITEEDKK